MPKFNGHRSRNAWNVSLWINNDESLYSSALFFVNHYRRAHGCGRTGRERAAREFLRTLKDQGTTHTPDGSPYTYTTVRAAMRDM